MAAPTSWTQGIDSERVMRWGRLTLSVVVPAALGGLFAAVFMYFATAKLNNDAAIQEEYQAALQQFIRTGSEMDASVTFLADTVIEENDLDQAKTDVRRAIASHAAAAQSMSEIVGQGNVDEYTSSLGTLRQLVDATDNPQSAIRASQARFDIMYNRTLIVREARRAIY